MWITKRRFAVLVVALALVALGSAAVSAEKPPLNPHPAPPDNSPRALAASYLDATLRTSLPSVFAGLVGTDDGGVGVYVTASTPSLGAIVQEAERRAGHRVAIRVIPGAQNDIAS